MLLWSAIAVLGVALVGLTAIIVLDVRAKGWSRWISTLHDWQGTLGTVAGFLSAAGALMLSTAIQSNAEVARSERAAMSIGLALAYEVERMVGPLQTAYSIVRDVDLDSDTVIDACQSVYTYLADYTIDDTPVYDASLAQTLDFGDYNLALFTRFYAFYHDLRHEFLLDREAQCESNAVGRLSYVKTMSVAAFSFFELVRQAYPTVTPLQPGMLPEEKADLTQ